MVQLYLSENEVLLVEAIEDVGYGELYDIELADEPKNVKKDLRDGNAKLIEYIRENGYLFLPLVTVHCGEAKQVDVTGVKTGIRFTKRIRF